ncbi:Ribonuclease H [Hyphodiscus hymeniophilus]|uniref:ribonuclease H n=1 Tax=Hyphodiscus hymeniophilus TaxID=353542 RepID=A0A9P7AZ63_9HELO|nr:Ribonuclease H [Hyphodiscus hymeniophilus]
METRQIEVAHWGMGSTWFYIPEDLRRTICDRCSGTIETDHYQCLGCNRGDYHICVKCAENGLYCQNDTHDWMKRTNTLTEFREPKTVDIGLITFSTARKYMKSYPSRFQPPHPQDTPAFLFDNEHRFIRRSDPREILIYTDGACSGNGQIHPKAGWAFVFRQSAYSEDGKLIHAGTICSSLELKGPTGHVYQHSSNRAELRAVIAALQYRDWSADCNRSWRSLVIATDSEYVAVNATERIDKWEQNGWKLSSFRGQRPADVKNQDLWKLMLKEIWKLQAEGVNVSFWRIPRELNGRADQYAKFGARMPAKDDFQILQPDGPVRAISIPYSP